MFWKKTKKHTIEVPGDYKVRLTRRYESTHSHSIDRIPEGTFADIDQWCVDMGLDKPTVQISFPPLHLCSGDSVDFNLDLKFNCGKTAMLFKLAWGGIGSMGMNVQATI